MPKLAFSLMLLATALSCTNTDPSLNYTNSEIVAYNLIKVSVDTAIHKNAEINTTNYVLDLNNVPSLNHKGIERYFSEKNKSFPTTIEDSTLIGKIGNNGIQIKKSMIFKIHEIKDSKDGLTKVSISKFISTHKYLEMNLFLKRQSNGYEIHSCLSLYINKTGQ